MRPIDSTAGRKTALRIAAIAFCVTAAAFGQQQINLSAGPASAVLSDGSTVPMWGYTCGALVTGSTASCTALSKTPGAWSPVVITVPTGQTLQINLTNNLKFTPAGTTSANTIPTSLVIVGQLGGGLGNGSSVKSPAHNSQTVSTWPTVGTTGGSFTPPAQGDRVQSFSTEVAGGATASLTWTTPRPGTYLIESGTHPSIQGPMGLYGMLVVTAAPTVASGTTTAQAGTAYPNIKYDAEVPLLFSEIDPVQNKSVDTAVRTAGFNETLVWSGRPDGCGNPTSTSYNTCYPPAVNYSPLYYLINGKTFDKTNAAASLFPTSPATIASPPPTGIATGQVLVRLVNAGLRMHVPAIVGAQTGATSIPGFSLIAEDGNRLPGVPRVQNEVFMAAGKTYDVMISAPSAGAPALPVFDRQLSLSGNATARDAGMLAYVGVNGGSVPAAPSLTAAVARPDTYGSVIPGVTLNVSDVGKGVIANDTNVGAVQVATAPSHGALILNANGTFKYTPDASWNSGTVTTSDSFIYKANGLATLTAVVTLNLAPPETSNSVTANNLTFTAKTATYINIPPPGVLTGAVDSNNYPLTAANITSSLGSKASLNVQPNGGFIASVPSAGSYTFTYQAKSSRGTLSNAATVTLNFPAPSNLAVTVKDPSPSGSTVADYRWIIEEDRTFYVDPNNTTNTATGTNGTSVATYGVNFHASWMPIVAQGCTGPLSCEMGQTLLGKAAACDSGNGICHNDVSQLTAVTPDQVVLDPSKRYYISVLPGDAPNSNLPNNPQGHGMGGAPIAPGQTAVTVLVEPTPFPPGKLSVVVFQDDNPLNGEQDSGGGVDVLSPNEPGLGGFNIVLLDAAGGSGDPTGQMTYDMFNNPLSNSLAGQKDPVTGKDACPISQQPTSDSTQAGITGMIVTCPKYESDGTTLSPLAGQAVIANLMPGRFSVVATPGADRIAKGEEWLQTNTLDGQKGHDAFIRVGEPPYFQEYGPAGYHVKIGFANPAIINGRLPSECQGTPCANSVTGKVTTTRTSRTPDERLYSSGSRDSFYFSQCYVSIGDTDGADFSLTKCDKDGNFTLNGLPDGNWRITLFDQWNDQIVDGLSVPVALKGGKPVNLGEVPVQQWQANLYTRTFIDDNRDGVSQAGETGIPLVPVTVRYRDGSLANSLNTDFSGVANFNETFPLFNWYVAEADSTRYKSTGVHVVYDAGGPADGTAACGANGNPPCGGSTIGKYLANTAEQVSLPANLRVPGSVYCAKADCTGYSIQNGPGSSAAPTNGTNYLSTGRIDPPWATTQGWQGFNGQNNFLEFGKIPYAAGENGGIKGHVVYASTRPFDDPQMLVQAQWEPLVPHVTINLYQESNAPDGSTALKLVDTTQTSSWDDWAQGFRSDGMPSMNCPGQTSSDLFYFTLYNQPNFLNAGTPLPNNSQFKCYDGMHNWNQLQPAPYDGMYAFPSVTGRDPGTGKATGSNCMVCGTNPTDGSTMLPVGKYVVEVVVPPGYELVKEEDKNILIGDGFIAPSTQEFGGNLTSIFILPDQAAVAASSYNAYNPNNQTTNLGVSPINGAVPGFPVEPLWPCVGQARIVPDFLSLFPSAKQVAPFAGATRNLCDRKEVTLGDQESVTAKFYIFTSTHIAAHFTGVITDDMTSEFDPFSPAFGEKFAPPNLPVSIKDWQGNEVSRVYSDHWGLFNGLQYSTWDVNPPNPTGYSPQMMVVCMNDPGPILSADGKTKITDPLFNPGYSQFCYELPFMPGQTQYMDTPVVPTAGFSEGYNHPDCAYPSATPAISSVTGDVAGPWVQKAGNTLTINALGDQLVNNYGYSGPSAAAAPFNLKTIPRHYGFGGSQGTGYVKIGGVKATVTKWTDTQIIVAVPAGIPNCQTQQQAQFSGGSSSAQCGELTVVSGNGKQSVDTVTVTVGGKTPTVMAAGQTIQSAIDAAQPGDMIIVPSGQYNEMVLLWKPLRLQGVGAASTIINANTHPAGKLDPWRRQVECLFGLALNGRAITGSNAYDPSSTYSCASTMQFQIDREPLEAVIGWDTTLNGNLAELLQEPTLLGAYEGAGITVLGKGVKFPAGSNPFGSDTFPTGTLLLTAGDCATGPNGTNPYPSNFWCNPSRIDGLSVTNSSQGGGGIFVHAWNHNLELSNNRVYNNAGTLGGGISVGQGEFPPAYLNGADIPAPGSCESTNVNNRQLPYCFDMHVNVHNNAVTQNSSLGDELFSATLTGSGGVTFCTGSDYYLFNYNWVCGNVSSGEGGGIAHLGYIKNGDIEHNSILFNQSTNPTIPTNGGGIVVMGAPDTDPVCGTVPDQDCPPGLGDGTGPGLTINANLIQGNAAESGSGGGIRLQSVNGTEVSRFPNTPSEWYGISITNNIIVNNVAGWDGAGISLQDALNVNVINNTVMSNDSTASSGVLFNTDGALLASVAPPTTTVTTSTPQPAGLVSIPNTSNLLASLPNTITCPVGHSSGNPFGTLGILPLPVTNGDCRKTSYPLLYNNVFWQNRAFNISVGGYNNQYQQNMVSLTPTLNQPGAAGITANGTGTIISGGTGACTPGASYWDIGVRGDTAPNSHDSGITLDPLYSVLTDAGDYTTLAPSSTNAHNTANNPQARSQYCNGSRVPPEFGGMGYQVPPGIADATVPNPIFNLTPNATVDEGNNWINISWGPLSSVNPVTSATLGNYALSATSPANDYVPVVNAFNQIAAFPNADFFGNPRPAANGTTYDVGAVEFQGASPALIEPSSLGFGNIGVGSTSSPQTLTLSAGDTPLIGLTLILAGPFARPAGNAGGTCNTGAINIAPNSACTINIVFVPTAGQTYNGSLTVNSAVAVIGSPVALSGTGFTTPLTVVPSSLTFPNTIVGTTSPSQTLTITGTASDIVVSLAGPFIVTGGTCPSTPTFGLPLANSTATTCTLAVAFKPDSLAATSGSATVSALNIKVGGSPVSLTATGVGASVTPNAINFGNVVPNSTSYPQTLTLHNTASSALTVTALTFSNAVFSRSANPSGAGWCSATLPIAVPANGICTFNVVFKPLMNATYTGSTLAFTANYAGANTKVYNAPVPLTGKGVTPTLPALAVLDNFNRAASSSLGASWNVLGNAIQISNNQAYCNNSGFFGLPCILGDNGFWQAASFGTNEAAAFQIANGTFNNDAVLLGSNGTVLLNTWTNFIRARINNNGSTGSVTVETTTTAGLSYTTAGSVATPAFAQNDILTAELDGTADVAAPTVYVWKTTGASCATSSTNVTTCSGGASSLIAAIQIPPNALWTNGGNVGIQIPPGGRVDNFMGGTVR